MALGRITSMFAPLERRLDALDAPRRLHFIGMVLGLGILGLLVIAPRLWRDHPYLAPLAVFSDSFRLGGSLDVTALALIAFAALTTLIGFRRDLAASILAGALVLRASWDTALWQPYLLQFGFYAAAVGVGLRRGGSEGRAETALVALRLATAGVYVWSGFSKLHLTWFEDGLFTFWGEGWFDLSKTVRQSMGLPAALFETALGVALFSRKWRAFGLYGLVGMHLFLLVMLGAVRQYNPVVWPWNAAMIGVLLLSFGGPSGAIDYRRLGVVLRRPLGWAAVILFGVLPFLSYAGVGSTYLSFRLYAYRYDEGYLVTDDEGKAGLPDLVREAMVDQTSSGLWKLDLFYWSEKEIGAFAPGDEIVFRAIASRIARDATAPDRLILVLRDPPPFNKRKRTQYELVWRDGGWAER